MQKQAMEKISVVIAVLWSLNSFAVTPEIIFEDSAVLTGSVFPGIAYTSASFADYNKDGLADFVLSGYSASAGRFTRVYRSNGNGTFSDINAGLVPVSSGASAWGDFDGDGDVDLVVTGVQVDDQTVTKLYRNDEGSFTDTGISLPRVFESAVAWGDFDGDGKLDLFLGGYLATGAADKVTKIYRNNGGGTFTDTNANLPNGADPTVAITDYDGDSLPDIYLNGTSRSWLLHNDGSFRFTQVTAGIPDAVYPSAAWGDYNGDGREDLVLSGIGGEYITRIYRNDGGGSFSEINPGLTGVMKGALAWGDYDGDGRPDLLLCGETRTGFTSYRKVCTIYHNDGGDSFSDVGANLAGLYQASAGFDDYDGDGDLDILTAGDKGGDVYETKIYRNSFPSSISGTVSSGEQLLPGVSVSLSGRASASTATDERGRYLFSGLYSGSYSVAASLKCYQFSPTAAAVSLDESVEVVNFADSNVATPTVTATVTPTFTNTVTPLPTKTPTTLPIATQTSTATVTATPASTNTRTPPLTETPTVPPTATMIHTPAATNTPFNSAPTPTPVRKVLPDLVIRKLVHPARGEAGKFLNVVVTIQNQGKAQSGAFALDIFLDVSGKVQENRMRIDRRSFKSIGAGEKINKPLKVKLPTGLAGAVFTLGAMVDPNGLIEEGNEENNVLISQKALRVKAAGKAEKRR